MGGRWAGRNLAARNGFFRQRVYDMNGIPLERTKALQALAGLKLSVSTHAGNMRNFGFGRLQACGAGIIGEYSLHLQCPWRIARGFDVVTGSNDWFEPEDEVDSGKITDDSWDPARGGSLQEARLARLFRHGKVGLKYLVNETDDLRVTGVTVGPAGGFELFLSPDYVLAVFPASSRGEHWRLFQPGGGPHFVVEAGAGGWE